MPGVQDNMDSVLFTNTFKELEEINSRSFDPKMAFNYNFMSGIHSLLKNQEGKLDFKLAAETLDAATKIYASKVEIVHKQTQKISTRFAMTGSDKVKDLAEKKKKTIKHLDEYTGRNIAKNSSAINGKIQKNLIIDPLYDRLSSAYDVANVSVLMSRQLSLLPNCTFALNSSDSLNFSTMNFKLDSSKLESYPYPFKTAKDIPTVHPGLRDFDFNDRSIDMEETVNQYKARLRTALEEGGDGDHSQDGIICEYPQPSPAHFDVEENFDSVQDTDVHIDDFAFAQDYDDLKVDDGSNDIQFGQLLAEMSMTNCDSPLDTDCFDTQKPEDSLYQLSQKTAVNERNKDFVVLNGRNLARQARFMMEIIESKKSGEFLSRGFLKKVFQKVGPEVRPKTLYDNQSSNKDKTTSVNKRTTKKANFEPLVLSFIKPSECSALGPSLTQAAIRKRVQMVNNERRRPYFFVRKEDLFKSFCNPKISFKLISEEEKEENKENNENHENNDDIFDEHLSFDGNDQMDLSLNDSIPFTLPTDTQPQTGQHTEFTKLPRYVTDFGENLDPFGLGEQNREFDANKVASGDLVPIEDKAIDYTTRMKKINIKKLKKIMFSFCEKFSIKKTDFDLYRQNNGHAPENCITFYKLIYYIIYHGDLDERTLDDLTVPIFFVAMLHLCNDKRLLLIKCDDDSGNFYIVFFE